MRQQLFLSLLFLWFLGGRNFAQVSPLPRAHAHNDYEHPRPLHDALAQGFTSVEADVHLRKGKLYVSHNRPWFRRKKRTLRHLYLEPLRKHIASNGGYVYANYQGAFYLMIDLKTAAAPTYTALREVLLEYEDMLTATTPREVRSGPVTVFLSGNRPLAEVPSDSLRLAALDGRPNDLGKGYDANLMPVVSDTYKKYLTWQGKGEVPQQELAALQNLVGRTHAEGKKLRFWASPDHPAVWQLLYENGVDLINTDDLAGLRAFLINKN